jgi:hypothetical protein
MGVAQAQKNIEVASSTNLRWDENCSVQKLLDIVASIMAEEYIEIAKQNPQIFSNNGGNK